MVVRGYARLAVDSSAPLVAYLSEESAASLRAPLLRMDRLCGLAVVVTNRLLTTQPELRQEVSGDEVAIVVGSAHGCHKTDEEYFRSFLQGQPSPRLFAYTLPSSPGGELSILYRLRGPGLTVCMGQTSGLAALAEAERILRVPELAALQSKVGWQFAPQIDPTLVTFTRPPLVAGADVSSIPPPDNCAGYLGARVDPRRVALIRIPHVAAIFETAALAPDTLYPDSEAAYTSLTMYGAAVNTYEPGEAESASLANAEFQPDATGGSTIVVWPRNLPTGERESLFDYARRNGWALIRGGKAGPFTTANMFLRLKGASPDYYGAYTPIPDVRTGVPCYFDNAPRGTPWTAIESAPDPMSYVASFQNIGDAAPQGVHCASVAEVLDGSCLNRLEAHIEDSGGTYFSSLSGPSSGSP